MLELARKALADGLGARVIDLHQHHQAGMSLHHSSDRRGIAGSLDQITFPVAGNLPASNLVWALRDLHHVRDLAAPIIAATAWPAILAMLTTMLDQLATQFATRQNVQGHVDRLMGHVMLRHVRMLGTKIGRNLLGRPLLAQPRHHRAPSLLACQLAWPSSNACSTHCSFFGNGGEIASIVRSIATTLDLTTE